MMFTFLKINCPDAMGILVYYMAILRSLPTECPLLEICLNLWILPVYDYLLMFIAYYLLLMVCHHNFMMNCLHFRVLTLVLIVRGLLVTVNFLLFPLNNLLLLDNLFSVAAMLLNPQ